MHSEKGFSPSTYISPITLNSDDVTYIHVLWNTIEPNAGEFDTELLASYANRCKSFQDEGKTVCVTLFNGNDPAWFTKEGGFATFSGNLLYQNYLKTSIEALSQFVDLWQPFQEIPSITDNTIGLIKETRTRILQSNIAICQLTAYIEIHRLLGYTYTTPEGAIRYVAVLTPPGICMDSWIDSVAYARKKGIQISDASLLDDSRIISISSSSK